MKCEICGRHFINIIIHHINGNRKENFDSNILCLCYDCHNSIHIGLKEKGEYKSKCKRRIRSYNKNCDLIRFRIKKYRKIWLESKSITKTYWMDGRLYEKNVAGRFIN